MDRPLYDYTDVNNPHQLFLLDAENHREKGEVRLYHSANVIGKPRGHLVSEIPVHFLLDYIHHLEERIAELTAPAPGIRGADTDSVPEEEKAPGPELTFVRELLETTGKLHDLVNARLTTLSGNLISSSTYDDLLHVCFEGLTTVDDDNPSAGLTYCDDLSPLDVLKAMGFEPPFTELVEDYRKRMGDDGAAE